MQRRTIGINLFTTFLLIITNHCWAIAALITDREGEQKDCYTIAMVARIKEREYYIERLKDVIAAFFKVQSKNQNQVFKTVCQEIKDHPDLFGNTHIADACKKCVESGTSDSIKFVWKDFKEYRYLDDATYTREFIVLMTLLYKHQVVSLLPSDIAHGIIEHLSAQPMTHATRAQTNGREKQIEICDGITCEDVMIQADSIAQLLHNQNVDDIIVSGTLRFYHIRRINKAVQLFLHRMPFIQGSSEHMRDHVHHPFIKKILQESSNDRTDKKKIARLWRHFESYGLIDDRGFLKDFTLCLIILYHDAIIAYHGERGKVSLHQAAELYETIVNLPVEEMLQLLDHLVNVYEDATNNYELNNKTLSWRDWFNKYSWVLPIAAVSVIVTILKNHELIFRFLRHFFPAPMYGEVITTSPDQSSIFSLDGMGLEGGSIARVPPQCREFVRHYNARVTAERSNVLPP